MEHLSKQQIILLTLLVSFVTSIATGIVTVSLMDQAPVGVTQTINRVVERTIERVVSESAPSTNSNTASVAVTLDPIAQAVEKVSKSLVRIKSSGAGSGSVSGLGLIVSSEGVIVTDKSAVASINNPVAVFHNGQEVPLQVIQSQINGDIVFVLPLIPKDRKSSVIFPASVASSTKLGQAVLTISGKDSYTLSQGIIEKTAENGENSIHSSISERDLMVGSPLFNIYGYVIGFKTTSLINNGSFYSLSALQPSIPVISR